MSPLVRRRLSALRSHSGSPPPPPPLATIGTRPYRPGVAALPRCCSPETRPQSPIAFVWRPSVPDSVVCVSFASSDNSRFSAHCRGVPVALRTRRRMRTLLRRPPPRCLRIPPMCRQTLLTLRILTRAAAAAAVVATIAVRRKISNRNLPRKTIASMQHTLRPLSSQIAKNSGQNANASLSLLRIAHYHSRNNTEPCRSRIRRKEMLSMWMRHCSPLLKKKKKKKKQKSSNS
mmetsp:Transcript_14592/g.43846  ORF Transcript_14592/g.43846 Transcript_14592/m.43846 type:complete len:232 (+) Transcript_14592:1303-1998(+)